MAGSEFDFRADDGQTLLARRSLPEVLRARSTQEGSGEGGKAPRQQTKSMKMLLAQKRRRTSSPEIEVSLTMTEDRVRRSTSQLLWHSPPANEEHEPPAPHHPRTIDQRSHRAAEKGLK